MDDLFYRRIKGLISFFGFTILLLSTFTLQGSPSDSTRRKEKKLLIFPVIFKSIETSWGFGGAGSFFFKTKRSDSLQRTSNIESLGLYTLNKQVISLLGCNVYFPQEKYILRWRNTYSDFPDKFWGLGNYTPEQNKEKYVFSQLFINPQFLRKFHKNFFLGATYEFQNVFKLNYIPGGLFDKENIIGKNGGIVSGFGGIIAFDTRNHAFYSTSGSFFQFSAIRFTDLFLSDFKYTNYVIDFRKYISINSKYVLAFQTLGYFNNGDVAYRNMATLGGSDMMRGYYSGRYRDKNSMAMQVENRFSILKRFGIVIFGSAGKVGSKSKDLNLRGIKFAYGGGLRFAVNKKEKLNLRLDYGFGKNSSGLYFTITEAF